ncbi:MAG TPA: OmpA family protein [Myxococcaceae bacterium]|nr:OmpA family protein [Myxococcaceae bacterium]
MISSRGRRCITAGIARACVVVFLAPWAARAQPVGEASANARIQRSELPQEGGGQPHSPSTLGNAFDDPSNQRHSPTVKGGVGLLHVLSADLGPNGILRFSAFGEYFKLSNFPVASASDTRVAGTFAISFVALEVLELSLSYSDSANTSSRSSPTLLTTLGDLSLGTKLAWQWTGGLHAGLGLAVNALSGSGDQDGRHYAFGVAPLALASYDFRSLSPQLPLRLHANGGAAFEGTVQNGNRVLNASEEFALRTNHFNRLTAAVGLEMPLPVLTPFVEYDMAYPLRVPSPGLVGPDGALVPIARAMAQTIGMGAKITAAKNLTLTAAVDLGLSRAVGLGIPATPAYNAFLGAAFHVEPFASARTQVVERVPERSSPIVKAPRTGRVHGVVIDAHTHRPVAGAIVTTLGSGIPPVATDSEAGSFLTQELSSGVLLITIQKDGYRPMRRELVLQAGSTEELQVELEALPKKSAVLVSVTAGNKPIAAAVSLRGPESHQIATLEGARSPARVQVLAGKYVADVFAQGYLAQTRDVEVPEGVDAELKLDLALEPKRKLVVVRENKIEILQQIHFANGKAIILSDSFKVLNQVVDAILQNGIKRIRIEGHTDSRGGKSFNQKLSETRAQSVGRYLERAGIHSTQIECAGFGDTRPVAPNITAHGREFNRRVEFAILER